MTNYFDNEVTEASDCCFIKTYIRTCWLTCCCDNRISFEKNQKHKVCFLGDFIKHSADEESQQSRHVLGERSRKARQASVCALRWIVRLSLGQIPTLWVCGLALIKPPSHHQWHPSQVHGHSVRDTIYLTF